MNNLIKAAAVTSALALAGTSAYANNAFSFQETVMDDSTITINNVTAEGPGIVVIYDYHTGEFGEVLGMTDVSKGANTDLRINLGTPPVNDIAAVLYVGDVSTPAYADAWIELDVSEDD